MYVKSTSPSEGANKKIVLQSHTKSLFWHWYCLCAFLTCHIFFLLLYVVHVVYGTVMFSGEKKCVDMADLFYSSFLFKLSQNQHFGTLYCSLFFSVILFFNTDLKCKEGVLHVWVMLPFHLFCYLCYHVLMLNSFSLRKKKHSWQLICTVHVSMNKLPFSALLTPWIFHLCSQRGQLWAVHCVLVCC